MHYEDRNDSWGPTTQATYKQEPYICIALPDGTTVDGKALAWTKDKVYALWVTGPLFEDRHLAWMDATDVTRINRDNSRWKDPYDDYAHYYPELPER
ncbi:hypothetical protein ABDK96_02150 [Citricoccus nitrophenolicus]|uniref:Uncharacterized protein n=1 Tax=Citricoccus nitrophenolicus TaxID=863575 RepID=A0ABV0IEA4_9MICC